MFLFLLTVKFFCLVFFNRSYLMTLMFFELTMMKLFFVLIFSKKIEPVFIYLYLMMVACESVIGLAMLVKISRKKKIGLVSISKTFLK